MRLKSFKVKDFRSIASTLEISAASNLTIVGPNNEGKSNLVNSLVASLKLLEEHSKTAEFVRMRAIGRRTPPDVYRWNRDYPVNLQENADGETEFKLKFDLDKADQEEFYRVLGSSINNNLPITIHIGRNNLPRFQVNKPGKGYASLTARSAQIAAFIGSKLSINYISAVRTARDSARSVEDLVSTALRRVERSPEFIQALGTIQELQRPVLQEIEDRLKDSLSAFVPSVKNVSLAIREGRSEALRSVAIGIDDGQLTPLASKGDGIISLIGMALLSKIDSIADRDLSMILVIEEPESHLHPTAIHAIRSTLDGLGNDIQVIITTHSPHLVNRVHISSNIVVERNQARIASSVEEIRDVLGVKVSDNLTSSRLNIICEGDNDCLPLTKILGEVDPLLAPLVENREISFSALGGAGNLPYLVNSLQNAVCEPLCLLDDDKAGREAFQRAQSAGLLNSNDVIFTSRLGKSEAEFEDLVADDVIAEVLLHQFGVNINKVGIPQSVRGRKFCERMGFYFKACGKIWDDQIEMRLKSAIARECNSLGIQSIHPDCHPVFFTLATLVRAKLGLEVGTVA